MNITITWAPGNTWRKLGYYYYTNSLDYREVIEQNPQWNVMELPPEGAVLSLSVEDSRTVSTTNNAGFFAQTNNQELQEIIFPFDYEEQYNAQAAKYNLYSVINYNECNGYTQDTIEAAFGQP